MHAYRTHIPYWLIGIISIWFLFAIRSIPEKEPPADIPEPIPTPQERGIWIWDHPSSMNQQEIEQKILAVHENGFDTVYLTIDDYLTLPASQKESYLQKLRTFVGFAQTYGIGVDVVGGERNWAQPNNRHKGFTLIDLALEYNRLYPEAPLRGFQYDVEPYLLPTYENNKATTLYEFVEFIDQSTAKLIGTHLQFAVVIPHFYDRTANWTPEIAYGGTTGFTYEILLNILEKKPGSSIIVMAYRNYFDNDNGVRVISEPEVLDATGSSTRIVIAQETGKVPPHYITFHGMSKNELLLALERIQAEFKIHPNFGGVAVHYLQPFLELEE